uniref:Bifunctional inhibitor/plant lipid transfer protein/seed storage helical domain-containing protein n=1 Tax=Physcomitrium patens TaxID=3218 RepID=A0A2K1I9P8_PHYPA|nr:hypothetical protein PHYPA_031229 [Physcomitrium patens]PNR26002.1 hypothetical protein PHYPA_031231 [Physcomitrium patens]PNR26003.1 hypothetical protein PHYPA_031232 [Physcomitrium patens]PNR26006.1 hypothetical protein PHYPA_031235 [Physcomitrium patens]
MAARQPLSLQLPPPTWDAHPGPAAASSPAAQHDTPCVSLSLTSTQCYNIPPPPRSLSTFITRSRCRCLSTRLRHPELPIFALPPIGQGVGVPSALRRSPSASAMKLLAVAAVSLILLVTSQMVVTSHAAGCDILKLTPCVAASRNAKVMPSRQCCSNIAGMGKGLPGAKCLCSLLSHPLARSQGVAPRIALGIPQKCRIAVPRGFVCQGTLSRLLPR